MSQYNNMSDKKAVALKYGYPDREKHKQYHEYFKRTVAEIAEQLEREGASIALIGKINSNVGNWLVSHIKREDTKVARHIAEQR